MHVQGTVSMRATSVPLRCASTLRAKALAIALEDPATSPAGAEDPPAMTLSGPGLEAPFMGAADRAPVCETSVCCGVGRRLCAPRETFYWPGFGF